MSDDEFARLVESMVATAERFAEIDAGRPPTDKGREASGRPRRSE
jgi:hypothetical protein